MILSRRYLQIISNVLELFHLHFYPTVSGWIFSRALMVDNCVFHISRSKVDGGFG